MDQLKKLGAAFANHYEKVILSVILLALLGTAAFLPFRVSESRETIRQALERIRSGKKKETQPVDTAQMEQLLRRAKLDPNLSLSGEHNLFNPVVWKKGNDRLFKVVRGDEEGPGGLAVTAIRPLSFVAEYDGVQRSGDNLRYRFMVLDETRGGRTSRPRPVYLSEGSGSRNDPFAIAKLNGPREDPTSIEIRFPDSTSVATVSRETPFRKTAGYEADLVHEKLGTRFSNVRNRQPGGIRLGTQAYNIVAITKDAVTVESSTGKRWTIRLKGSSER